MALTGFNVVETKVSPKKTKTFQDVKDALVANINLAIDEVSKGSIPTEPKRWLAQEGDNYRLSVRLGIIPVYFAKGMGEGKTAVLVSSLSDAGDVLTKVREAVKEGKLDKEVREAWDKRGKGRGKKAS